MPDGHSIPIAQGSARGVAELEELLDVLRHHLEDPNTLAIPTLLPRVRSRACRLAQAQLIDTT